MQSHYPFEFEREMGCTAGELRGWLPGASRGAEIDWSERAACLPLDGGTVTIDWAELTPRRIALVTLPRLAVRFRAQGVDAAAWHAFMRHFDLYTQRGGG
jgi:hypothetical protein